MSPPRPPVHHRFAAMLRAPMTWIALALLLLVVAGTATVAVELYSSTSEPMVVNSR
jgi:hypothetical protein